MLHQSVSINTYFASWTVVRLTQLLLQQVQQVLTWQQQTLLLSKLGLDLQALLCSADTASLDLISLKAGAGTIHRPAKHIVKGTIFDKALGLRQQCLPHLPSNRQLLLQALLGSADMGSLDLACLKLGADTVHRLLKRIAGRMTFDKDPDMGETATPATLT